MHIAICDDNIVDRNRLEKLLNRESDTRIKTTGVLTIDAFGSMESLLKTPMLYDLFFLDRTTQAPLGGEAAAMLRAAGVVAPIVMCCSAIPYRNLEGTIPNLFFIDKPFVPGDLSGMVTIAYEQLQSRIPRLEFRSNDGTTHYILPDEWVYAFSGEYEMQIMLADGRTIAQQGNMPALESLVEDRCEFIVFDRKYLINRKHILEIRKKSILLDNGTELHASGFFSGLFASRK